MAELAAMALGGNPETVRAALGGEPPAPGAAPVDPEEAADQAVARLAAINALLATRLEEELRSPEPDIRLVKDLTTVQVLTSKELLRMRPPPSVDPETDPSNLAARDSLRARLAAMVEAAETALAPAAA